MGQRLVYLQSTFMSFLDMANKKPGVWQEVGFQDGAKRPNFLMH